MMLSICLSVCLFVRYCVAFLFSMQLEVCFSPNAIWGSSSGASRIVSDRLVNPLDSKGNYSATSNKLVHWLLVVGCYIW